MLRKFLVVVLLFLSNALLHGQNAQELLKSCDAVYSADPDSSYALSLRIETIAREQHDTLLLAKALAKKARYHILKSQFEDARSEVNDAIAFSEKKNDASNEAYALKLKAILLRRIGNEEEALSLQEQAVVLYSSVRDTAGKINVWLNLSNNYVALKKYDKAKAVLDSIALYPQQLSTSNGYFYHQNRGKWYTTQNQYEAALDEYALAKPIALQFRLTDSYVTLLTLIAEAQLHINDLAGAEASLDESCRLARENHLDNELDEALIQLTQLYVSKGDYRKAFATQQEKDSLEKVMYNIERINKINELEKRLELSEKEKQLTKKDLDLAKEKNEQERLRAQNIQLYIIIFFVFAVAVLTLLLLVRTRRLNTQIAGQKQLIEEKSAIIEDAYTSIRDSISYSKRIQNAILPTDAIVRSMFPESFILYKPKDIVSGDFYWFERWGNEILFAAVDCTGHGVPGAFMSIVGYNQLNEAVNVHGLAKPNLILNALNKGVSKALRQTDDEAVRDGMDIALCVYEPETRKLQFAGAYNPLWIVRGTEVIEVAADKQPIGAYPGQELKPFTLKELQLQPGDCLYLFSDGYADQFGGPNGKKFKYKKLQEVLKENASRDMTAQKNVLEEKFRQWMGSYEQVDDVLIIGIRV